MKRAIKLPKDDQVYFRLNRATKAKLGKLADGMGITLSDVVRNLIDAVLCQSENTLIGVLEESRQLDKKIDKALELVNIRQQEYEMLRAQYIETNASVAAIKAVREGFRIKVAK